MVRWRYTLVLATLLLLTMGDVKPESDEDEDQSEDVNDDSGDDVNDEDKTTKAPTRRPIQAVSKWHKSLTRTASKKPLECYVCAFIPETPLRACIDPIKNRVHTVTCHSANDQCHTSVTLKGHNYDTVVRGCRSSCRSSAETTCCDSNRCNNQAFVMPVVAPRALKTAPRNKSSKNSPSIFFFVTVLLVLQTVVKVAFV